MMLALVATLVMHQGGGAPMVGFSKSECALKKIRGAPSLTLSNPTAVGETELYKSASLTVGREAEGEYPRVVKIKGIKASSVERTVTVVIAMQLDAATTLRSPTIYRLQSSYPSHFSDIKESGYHLLVMENKEFSFKLPAGATTAKLQCDKPWLKGAIGGNADDSARAESLSMIKSWSIQ